MSEDNFKIVFEKMNEELKKQYNESYFDVMEITEKIKQLTEVINDISSDEDYFYTRAG